MANMFFFKMTGHEDEGRDHGYAKTLNNGKPNKEQTVAEKRTKI
jgi:hypothetical protein